MSHTLEPDKVPLMCGSIPSEVVLQKYIRILLTFSKTAFTNDDEYLLLLEGIFYLFFMLYDCNTGLIANLLTRPRQIVSSIDTSNSQNLTCTQAFTFINSLLEQLQHLMHEKLEASKIDNNYRPRIERLSEKLQLTEKEKIAFQYIVLYNIGIHCPADSDPRGTLRRVAIVADMSSREILNFLTPSRKHMQDGLFENTDSILSNNEFSNVTFTINKETLFALMGANLTAEQFLMVDNTTLGEVLKNEGVQPSTLPSVGHNVKNVNLKQKKGDKKESEKDSDKEDETEFQDLLDNETDPDVYAILKSLADEDKDKDKDKDNDNDNDNDKDNNEESKQEKLENQENNILNTDEKTEQGSIDVYKDDLEYLQDFFKVIELRILAFTSSLEDTDSMKFEKKTQKTTLRELKNKEKQAYKKCMARLQVTMDRNQWWPRMERLIQNRHLEEFERWVVLTLIGCILSVDILKAIQQRRQDSFTVGEMLAVHCEDLRNQIECRKYFYKTATLVKEDIVHVQAPRYLHNSDLMHYSLEIDRRMVDYVVGLDSEFGALVQGSCLYSPTVLLDDVILPKVKKDLIINTISSMDELRRTLHKLGLTRDDEVTEDTPTKETTDSHKNKPKREPNTANIGYGNGTVVLFFGMSGTGKTMMAHAVANFFHRKLLLLNFPALQKDKMEEMLRLAFREAKIQNAIVFFDECESLFESRDIRSGSVSQVNVALTMIEQYDGLILLATNRPFDLDEAMHRRIQLVVEFPPPDMHLREQIWQNHIPKKHIKVTDDIDLQKLSIEFELTGGFIRNAVMSALKNAIIRQKQEKTEQIELRMEDLWNACRQQIIGQLELTGFNRRVVPEKCLGDVVLDQPVKNTVEAIIHRSKSAKVLASQWGFESECTAVLISGPDGVGKSTLAEVIAYECGKPMKVLTCAELLHLHRLRGLNTANDNVFSDLNSGAILVVENAELLFNGRAQDHAVGFILFQMRLYSSIFIFITQGEFHKGHLLSMSAVQKTFFKQFHYVIRLEHPNNKMRSQVWRKIIPAQTPLQSADTDQKQTTESIDFDELSIKFPKFTHKDIKRTIVEACGMACLRKEPRERYLKMADLVTCATNLEEKLENDELSVRGLYGMYT